MVGPASVPAHGSGGTGFLASAVSNPSASQAVGKNSGGGKKVENERKKTGKSLAWNDINKYKQQVNQYEKFIALPSPLSGKKCRTTAKHSRNERDMSEKIKAKNIFKYTISISYKIFQKLSAVTGKSCRLAPLSPELLTGSRQRSILKIPFPAG
jgi:hypothetical protein